MTEDMFQADLCKCNIVHHDVIDEVKKALIRDQECNRLAEFFKIFGDPSRVKILHALSLAEMCVCDIAALLDMTQSAVSHQLKVLRQARLVKNRRDGKIMYYSPNDDHIRTLLHQGLDHIRE